MDKLKRTLELHKDEYIRYLLELVAIDTHDFGHGIDGGLEKEGQEYLAKLFEKMNASKIERDDMREDIIQKCIKEHNEGNPGHNYDDRYNLYGTFKGKKDKSILFNGHMDTMPAGNIDYWKIPPHEPKVVDGKLYGLGSCDMKSGILASALAVKLLQDADVELPCDVIISSVCDEEGGGNGSMVAAMNGQKADGVVVCEGTSDELILAHMGFVFFTVKVQGLACQSGLKKRGVSAIEKSFKIISSLNELEHKWLLNYKHHLLPPPSLNVGVIEGGTAGSTVAGECSFKTCVHYHPNTMSYEQVVKEFTDAVMRTAKADEWLCEHEPEISIYQAGGSFEMDETHDFVFAFREGYKAAMSKDVKVVGSPAGCDSRIWKNIAKCPTIQFGPGNLEQCHAVDEWVSVEDYLNSILVYAELILSFGNK